MTDLREGTWHIPIIRAAVQALGGSCTYVEIGVRDGACFDQIAPFTREAHAVDIEDRPPAWKQFWRMTSDEFFDQYSGPADVVFIDGDHRYEQVRRDFANSIRVLSPDGIVFLHDTWPVDRGMLPDTGDVWRLAAEIEQDEGLNAVTYRRYPGLTVVQRPRLERF